VTWRVLVVEDNTNMRDHLAGAVEEDTRLQLSASFGTFAEAKLALLSTEKFDVLLVDLSLPDGSGIDLIRLAVSHQPQCEALVISMFGDDERVIASIEAGAMGYIQKDAKVENIANTICEMKQGASPISPMIARRILAKFKQPSRPAESIEAVDADLADSYDKPRLTPKESHILTFISRGYSYEEIANLDGISISTVRTHIQSLYQKLAVHSRSEAVFEAAKMGLLKDVFEVGG
jgi:DNA-binding NarL/FixJ family response regulator